MLNKKTNKEIKDLQKKYMISDKDLYSFRIISNHFIDFLNDDKAILPTKNIQVYFNNFATDNEKQIFLEKYEMLAIQISAILNTTKNLTILKRYYMPIRN